MLLDFSPYLGHLYRVLRHMLASILFLHPHHKQRVRVELIPCLIARRRSICEQGTACGGSFLQLVLLLRRHILLFPEQISLLLARLLRRIHQGPTLVHELEPLNFVYVTGLRRLHLQFLQLPLLGDFLPHFFHPPLLVSLLLLALPHLCLHRDATGMP